MYRDLYGSVSKGSEIMQEVKKNLSTTEHREYSDLEITVSRMWRDYWIRVFHRHGYSMVTIAKEFEVSESTVRNVLRR